jgi:hypothetical protein
LVRVHGTQSAESGGGAGCSPGNREVLLCIVEIGKLDPSEFDPREAAEFQALCLVGQALDAWLQPFINAQLSLSEQIESLIKFSHLI